MRLHIITVSQKKPVWLELAFEEYHKRFPKDYPCSITEIPLEKRHKSAPVSKLIEAEGSKILAAVPKNSRTIALDVKGTFWSTERLAENLAVFEQQTPILNFLIGGPDGLSEDCLKKAAVSWSLSPLTFPHPIVRLILIEQLYRAISILKGHPYHRGS